MRDGFMANTSIGRFWRLYLRNVAGFLPHKNDKATFGNTWRVVVAENEDVVKEIGWKPLSVDMGYEAGDNTVTVSRFTGGNHISSISGSTPDEMLPYLADAVVRQYSWQIMFTVGQGMGTLRPLILLGPIIARTIASWGWSKEELKQYLFDHARIPARAVRTHPARLDGKADLESRGRVSARTHPARLLRVGRSGPDGATRMGAGRLHDRRDRRSCT